MCSPLFDRAPVSRDVDCYGLTKICEILGDAKDLTVLSVAGRYKQLVQYGGESAHKSRARGAPSSLGVYMYANQHISKENETISGA
jgi:hypothetical protein